MGRYDDGYRGSRYGRRERRASRERTFELTVYLFIVGLCLLPGFVTNIKPAFVTLAGGGILVASAIYQWQHRWRFNPLTVVAGIIMLLIGIPNLQNGHVPGENLLPLGIMIGIIVVGFFTGDL